MKAEYKIREQWVSEEVALQDFERRLQRDLMTYGVAFVEDMGGGMKRIIDPRKIRIERPKKKLPWYRRLWNVIRKRRYE